MAYTSTSHGIPIQSNVPLAEAQPSGTRYVVDINFKFPFVNMITDYGIDVISLLPETWFISIFAAAARKIWNVSVSTPNNTTLEVAFTATSPAVGTAIDIILSNLPVILVTLAAFLVYNIVVTVTNSPTFNLLALGIGIVAIGGLVTTLYSIAESPSSRARIAERVTSYGV